MSGHIFGMPILLPIALLHLLGHSDQNEVKNVFYGHIIQLPLMLALHDAVSIVQGTITFLT